MSSVDAAVLNHAQTLAVYTPGLVVDPEPPQTNTFLPPPRMPDIGRGTSRAKTTDAITVAPLNELVDAVQEEEKQPIQKSTDKENDNRTFTTLVVLIVLGGMLQGNVSNPDLRVTLSAIAMMAIPLAYYANRN